MPLPNFFFDPVVVASLPIMWYLAANMLLPFLLRAQKKRLSLLDWLVVLGSAAMFALVVLADIRAVGVEMLMIPVYWSTAAGTAVHLRYITKSSPMATLYFIVLNTWFFIFSLSKITALIVGR
ncbi:MAG: hypothetical protein QXP98_05765 [Thermoproteus sp.]